MSKKEKKDNGVFVSVVFALIGILLIGGGANEALKKMSYEEAQGTYTHSEMYTSRDSDGNEFTHFRWYYDYYVNDNRYEAEYSSRNWEKPSKTIETILYDPNNPSKAVLKNDHQGIMLIIAGIVFCSAPFLIYKSRKDENGRVLDSYSQKKKSDSLFFAIVWLAFCTLFFLIVLLSINFEISMLFKHYFVATIIMLIFLGIGVVLLVDALKPDKYYSKDGWETIKNIYNENKNDVNSTKTRLDNSYDGLNNDILKYNKNENSINEYSYDKNESSVNEYSYDKNESNVNEYGYDENESNIDDYKYNNDNTSSYHIDDNGYKYTISKNRTINPDDVKKIARKAYGIFRIISGFMWCGLIFCIFYLPQIFDNGNTTYYYNGVEVSKSEFYANSSLISLIFLVIGILVIISGFVSVFSKKDK